MENNFNINLFLEEHNINETMNLINSYLSQPIAKKLLKKEYLSDNNQHYTYGHCYVASEVLYHLCGGKDVFSSYSGRDYKNGTHWWLKHKKTGKIFDVTAEQYFFKEEKPPYDKGKPVGFLTREPSKRAKIIIEAITLKNTNFKIKP